MPKQLRAKDKVRLDPLQAVKRASMHRGLVIGDQQPPEATAKPDDSGVSHKAASAEKKQPETKATPKTREPEEEPDDSRQMGEKKGTENQDPGVKSAKGPDNLMELTESSQDILYEASTVFPFTLFPDTITLDREKLTIADRFFWRTAKITSTPISEIMSCEANVGPFFGSLHLTFRFFTDNQRTVNFLPRQDALQMQRMIHGFIIAHRREVDTSNIDKEDLINLLMELGQGASE